MKLDDSAIVHIAKCLQIAILTGTDVVDNLRQLELVEEDGALFIDPDHAKLFEENLQKMVSEAEALQAEAGQANSDFSF